MASTQIMKSTICPFPTSGFRELSWFSSEFDSVLHRKRVLGSRRRMGVVAGKRLRVCCKIQESDSTRSNGEEPPESLFMKELRRRGITPTSLLEESKRNILDEEMIEREGDTVFATRNAVSPDFNKNLTNQREQSMALNSEGLEGLVPRAKLLLRLGGTFFFGFWPMILITLAVFWALYSYLGPTFVHDASKTSVTPTTPYIDPYVLLQDERIAQ
ncbi:hypothetical protein Ancab_027894 [Ancistrocladus abbreviatus]